MKATFLTLAASLTVALATAWPSASWALQLPGQCGDDEHVRCARYDVNEVYQIDTRAGNATLIQFEPGEIVDGEASAVGIGDAKAWKVGAGGNWILLKPQAVNPDTNLLVVTSRRRYTFQLVTAAKGEAPTWSLSFDYPDTRARLAEEAAHKKARVDEVLKGSGADSLAAPHRNENYDMRGDKALAPTAMWDDGRFTYLRYATTRQLPAIFRTLPDGSEALVNQRVDGDTVVVHETASAFVLRDGNAVLGVRNNAYTPDGQFNAAGTTVPDAARLTKEVHQ
jgi:type IV secretion system protein VirB9